MEALRTDDGWLEYRLRAVRDALLDQGAQTAEGGSTVDMVNAALLEKDEALQKARTTLDEVQTAAAEKETALAVAWAQLQGTAPPSKGHGLGRPRPMRRPRRSSGWGLTWRIRSPRFPRWGTPGAKRAPTGRDSAPAGAVRPQGGPGCL
jgi:hypothetical protein